MTAADAQTNTSERREKKCRTDVREGRGAHEPAGECGCSEAIWCWSIVSIPALLYRLRWYSILRNQIPLE
jgi:hypothetical protein